MHGLQACLFQYITVVAFHIYAQVGEDAAKKGVWMMMENNRKSMELCF